jgi:CRP-like cAMP-binding protein
MSSLDVDRIPVLAVLSPKDRERVVASARQRTYAAGEVVVAEGEGAYNLFLIASGHADIELRGGHVRTIGPGDFFGELGILEEHPRTATVRAHDELTCLLLPAWEFRSLLQEHPAMAVPMLHALIARLHQSTPHEH